MGLNHGKWKFYSVQLAQALLLFRVSFFYKNFVVFLICRRESWLKGRPSVHLSRANFTSDCLPNSGKKTGTTLGEWLIAFV